MSGIGTVAEPTLDLIDGVEAPTLRTEVRTMEEACAKPAQPASNPAHKSLGERLTAGARWVFIGRVLGIATTVASNILLAWLLTPAEFGAYALAMSVIAFASGIAALGLNFANVRFLSEGLALGRVKRARQELRLSFWLTAVGTTIVAGPALVALWWFTGGFASLTSPALLLAWVGIGLAAFALQQVLAESLRGLHELRFASLLSGGMAGGPLANLLFLAMLLTVAGVSGATLGWAISLNVIAIIATVPLGIYWLRGTTRQRFAETRADDHSETTVAEILHVCIPLMLIQALAFITLQADLWIAGWYCSYDDVGLFNAARRLMLMVSMPVQIVLLAVISLIPELKAQRREAELQNLLRSTATIAAVPSLAVLAVLMVFPAPILELLFGSFYRQAALPLVILAVGQCGLIVFGNPNHLLALTGHHHAALAANIATAAVLVTTGMYAGSRWGIAGVASAASLSMFLQNAIQWILARRLLGVWTHVGQPDWQLLVRSKSKPKLQA